jgi:ABC-type multidrug transport system fused ATPase/permease subunit
LNVVPSRALKSRVRKYTDLLRYAARRRGGWATIAGVTLLSAVVGLAAPLPLKVLVDNVLGSQPPPELLAWLPGAGSAEGLLVWVVVAEIAVFLAATAVDVALTMLWLVVGQAMVYDVVRDVFAKVQRSSLPEHLKHPIGDTMERVAGDSWAVHTVVDELIFTPLSALVTIAGIGAIMWQLAPELTVVSFAVAPVMAAAAVALGKPVREAGERRRVVEGELQSHVQQTLAGITVVQAFGQEWRQHRHFEQLAGAAVGSELRLAFASGLNTLAAGMAGTLGAAVVLLVGANQALDGDMTIGALVVFIPYLAMLQAQLGGLTGMYPSLQAARPSIDRVVEVLDASPDVVDRPGAVALSGVRGDVRFDGVWFGYEPGRPVLRGVSFGARPGEVVAVVGPTGAGKSTLAGMLPRFFDPDRGGVLLDGRDLRDLRLEVVRRSVSLVLQESFLFPFSIAENIAYGRPGASREEIEAAARAANAHEFVSGLPDGYDTRVGERGATLSGGERQRVAIARALLRDAPVLVLDEPTSALDAESERALLEALERLMAGRTTLVIAHRLSTIRRAHQILVLRAGGIVERGSHDELIALDGAYARMHAIQQADTAGRRADS